jgi:hypothetical protein
LQSWEIEAIIAGCTQKRVGPCERECFLINLKSVRAIATDRGIPVLEVEIAALEKGVIPSYKEEKQSPSTAVMLI